MSLSRKVFNGSVWTLLVSWINRSIGLIATLILVRILSPVDFGIAALATMIMFLFMSLCELGIRQYITKTQDISADDVNCAWSLQITINFLVSSLLFFAAPFIATLLENSQLTDVLRVLAFIPAIAALNNPGMILLEKALKYSQTSKVSIGARLLTTPVTVYLAVVFKTYWALILGQLLNILVICLFSYVFIHHRPRFHLRGSTRILSKTKWLLINTLTGFMRSKAENLIVNSKFGAEGVGLYDISKEFSHLPLTDIIGPASAPLLAGVSSITTGIGDVYNAILKYLYVAMFFIVPSIIGIFLVGELFIDVVLGSKWQDAVPVFKMISLLMIVFPIYNCCRLIMLIKDDLKILSILDVLSIVTMVIFLLPEFISNLEQLAIGRVIIGGAFGLVLVGVLYFRYKLNPLPILVLYSCLILVCMPFAGAVYAVKLFTADISVVLSFIFTVTTGIIVYLLSLALCIEKLSKVNRYFLFTKEFIDDFIVKIKSASKFKTQERR